jgi:hypothetical protein
VGFSGGLKKGEHVLPAASEVFSPELELTPAVAFSPEWIYSSLAASKVALPPPERASRLADEPAEEFRLSRESQSLVFHHISKSRGMVPNVFPGTTP